MKSLLYKTMRKIKFLYVLLIACQCIDLFQKKEFITHTPSNYHKAVTRGNGDVIIVSCTDTGSCKESMLSNVADIVDGNKTFSYSFNPTSEMVQKGEKTCLTGTKFGTENTYFYSFINITKEEKSFNAFTDVKEKLTSFPLKSGYVLLGYINKNANGAGAAGVTLVNPGEAKFEGNGLTFPGVSKLISCYEQVENNIYCALVTEENIMINKLSLIHLVLNDSTFEIKSNKVIKTFYTEFNFLKAIPSRNNEAAILFQIGNPNNDLDYGNTGKDLFYYLISGSDDTLEVERYDYLYNDCLFKEDKESYNADIKELSEHYTYVVCETSSNRLHGVLIIKDQRVKEEDHFEFENFQEKKLGYPQFAKFKNSLGLFYTKLNSKKTALQQINFPDCENHILNTIIVPKYMSTKIDMLGKIFLTNPYPNRYESSQLGMIVSSEKTTVLDENDNLYKGQMLTPGIVKIKRPEPGEYYIYYTAYYHDDLDGWIEGKQCYYKTFTPECYEGCYSCSQKASKNDRSHYCFNCVKGYYHVNDPYAENTDWGLPHNCKNCHEACEECLDGPINFDKLYTFTNCLPKENDYNYCNTNDHYYPLFNNTKLCMNQSMSDDYGKYKNNSLYLEKHNSTDEKKWEWRFCYYLCKECIREGSEIEHHCTVCRDDLNKPEEYHFMWNEKEDIPGMCYTGKNGSGYFIKDEDNKYYPCLDNCKECKNETICEMCFPEFYLSWLKQDSCKKVCDDEEHTGLDNETWSCVNCKYGRWNRWAEKPYYKHWKNYNRYCVDSIPDDEHIIDDEWNIIMNCDERCFTCKEDHVNSDKCTKCSNGYYKEHFIDSNRDYWSCYTKEECEFKSTGGGIAMESYLDHGKFCYNCKFNTDEKKYRIPYIKQSSSDKNELACTEKIPHTFERNTSYGGLDWCYIACDECKGYGSPSVQECTKCYTNYHLTGCNGYNGNCGRDVVLPCDGKPYYHDFIEDKDICTGTDYCNEDYPCYEKATHECYEACPGSCIINQKCEIHNNTDSFSSWFDNPLQLENLTESLNDNENYLKIASEMFQNLTKTSTLTASLGINFTAALKSGKGFTLPESKVIEYNDAEIEFTSFALQQAAYAQLLTTDLKNAAKSIVDLTNCGNILKAQYNLPSSEDLIIIKGDFDANTLPELASILPQTDTKYHVFSTTKAQFLDLDYCVKQNINIVITKTYSSPLNLLKNRRLEEQDEFVTKISTVIDNSYDPFNPNSPFYIDVCSPFKNEYGTDALLDERKNDYFKEKLHICGNCEYKGFLENMKYYQCECPVQVSGKTTEVQLVNKEIPEEWYKKQKNSNIEVFKCAKTLFSTKGLSGNYGLYFLCTTLVIFIISSVLYLKNIGKFTRYELDKITKETKIRDKNPDEEKKMYDEFVKKTEKENEIINNEEINDLDFNEAKNKDVARGLLKTFWSLLQQKQVCLFTFYNSNGSISRIIKISMFMVFLNFYFAFTALFFNDEIIRNIYIYKGNTTAAIHIPNIILSSLVCIIITSIIKFLILPKKIALQIRNLKVKEEQDNFISNTVNCFNKKIYVLFSISTAILLICLYYVSVFCSVFKNSQGHYFIDVLVAFILCNVWPIITSFLAAFIRVKSLEGNGKEILYTISKIISLL